MPTEATADGLDRPEIPLHTNGSENDVRCHVTKRKVSGGTRSDTGRDDIVRRIILDLIEAGYAIGVNDGEATVLRHSTDIDEITGVMWVGANAVQPQTTLIAYETRHQGSGLSYRQIGWVTLTHGHGLDMLNSWSSGIDAQIEPVLSWLTSAECQLAA
jgi:hypothetical protein